MDENILLYQVRPGDTLDKIGGKIGMTGSQLKDFHNTYCGKMERLWFNNLAGVRQLIIPKEYKSPEQIREEKETELPPSRVTRDFYATDYTVKEMFSDLSGDPLEIEYKIDVSFKKEQEINSPDEIVDVKCYDFKKNGTTPDDKMSEISLACMESIYPISFIISFSGKICGIFEFEKLKQRFQEKRPDLDAFFIGEIYKAYLDKFQAVLEKQEYMLKQFSSVLLYKILFPQMECFRKTGKWTQEFCLLQNSFSVKCLMNAEYHHTEPKTAETLIKGYIEEPLSIQEILRGVRFTEEPEKPADGEIEFRYRTDKKTKKMLQAEASVILNSEDELYRKQTIKLISNEKIS
ncbi:hypothetical protein QE422_003318 [Chryseobacterium sp. SORGH_AS 447]|uniref:hypothetical protein n=1 Tax=Chryseobacterium sp. SORGH_AS_0447 TaxID=3041769 RepID=UPI002787BD96|nr:hypothetical protein [Chryseobacterium sp. SORGH_AS_0447]MDQ1162950.1 hypothetical protein [Chryseobacterium sp. SORGH_AS_0447]